MKEILYKIAKNNTNDFIDVEIALKGVDYKCIICNQPVILRKSKKQQRRTHFAHKNLTTNCTPESALHLAFKTLLYKRLIKSLEIGKSEIINWNCQYCNEIHSGNLLKKINRIEMEQYVNQYKPDISLYDKYDKIFAVIEIIVSHKPEMELVEYYKDNNIAMVQFELKSDDDLDQLKQDILIPSSINLCINPKCEKCGSFMQKRKLYIIDGDCWKCKSKIKVAGIRQVVGTTESPSEFYENEITIARNKGVKIELKYSKTANEKYLANVCPHCNSMIGDHFLFTDYISRAEFGELNHELIYTDFACEKCYWENAYNENDE